MVVKTRANKMTNHNEKTMRTMRVTLIFVIATSTANPCPLSPLSSEQIPLRHSFRADFRI